MRELIREILAFSRAWLKRDLLLTHLILLAILIGFNYHFDFEDEFIDSYKGSWLKGVWIFIYNGLPYLISCLLVYFSRRETSFIRKREFWLYFLIGFTILSFDRSWYVWPYFSEIFTDEKARFVYSVIIKGKSILSLIIPLLLFAVWKEKDAPGGYFGLISPKFSAIPYFKVLYVAVLIVACGVFFSDLREFYPKYLRSGGEIFALKMMWPEWVSVVIYEIAYGFDFISTEFFFRGFLMIGMVRFLGPYAIYPMVVAYCVLHFGKPMTEAISSIFGGYILGIFAYYHRSIWGGVILHVGVAWTMEIVAGLARI